MATHLITGGNGYLGAFIARRLIEMGEVVRVVDVVDDPQRDERSEFLKIDILDRESLDRAMEGVDFVHHNAALVPLKKAGDRFRRVNVEGTRNVIEIALKHKIKHFSHMSSSAVFGNVSIKDCPIKGDPDHLYPIEIYGKSKKDGEDIVKSFMHTSEMSCSIIRPRTIIGTERLGIFQILFEWISEGRNIWIIGDGNNLFQFAHIDDLVDVSIETALKGITGIFNVGTDRYSTLRDSLQSLCDYAGTGSSVKGIPPNLAIPPLWLADKLKVSPLGPWHYLTYHKPYYFDLSSELSKLEWKPKYSNEAMLKNSYEWYMSNKDEISKNKHDAKSAHRGGLKQGVLKLIKKLS